MVRPMISPSLICMDRTKTKQQIEELMALGIPYMHVDMIDGRFSPDIPLTFEQLDEITRETTFPMDFHIMAVDNENYIKKALEYHPVQICFHAEACIHIDRMLNLIKQSGVRCGLALAPATPLHVLEYAAELCDFVLLMLINPGYASLGGEKMVPYAYRKIKECREFLDRHGLSIPIEVDGRVSLECMSELVASGADILVNGSTGIFRRENTFEVNYEKIQSAIEKGLMIRKQKGTISCTEKTEI